jgi:hypothetical protein
VDLPAHRLLAGRARKERSSVTAYAEYQAAVAAYERDHPEQRVGQAHCNVLWLRHPQLADEIRGDQTFDPFYVDDRLTAFLGFVKLRLAAAA